MRTVIALVLALLAGGAFAAETMPPRTPIRPIGDCLRVGQINEWHIIDDRTATVRTGPRRYVVELQARCPRLGQPPAGLIFHPNRSNLALGVYRICGEVGETVSSYHQPPCAIQSVRVVGKAEFDRLSAKSRRSGSAADQPATKP